jgi:hypothetical protein
LESEGDLLIARAARLDDLQGCLSRGQLISILLLGAGRFYQLAFGLLELKVGLLQC